MLKTKTTVTNQPWNLNLRVRVGQCVSHIGRDWTSITGINTEPGFNSSNWELMSPIKNEPLPIVVVFGNPFTLIKHPQNNDPLLAKVIQNNDAIKDGWRDNDIYWPLAFCIDDSNINDGASWDEVNPIEEIVLV